MTQQRATLAARRAGRVSPTIVGCVSATLMFSGCSGGPDAPAMEVFAGRVAPPAVLTRVDGEVSVCRRSCASPEIGDALDEGSSAATGRGELVMEWPDGCRARIGRVGMARVPGKAGGGRFAPRIELAWGHLLVACSRARNSNGFRAATPQGLVEILGGDAALDVLDDRLVRVFVIRGEARVTARRRTESPRAGRFLEMRAGEEPGPEQRMSAATWERFLDEERTMREAPPERVSHEGKLRGIDLSEEFRLWDDARFGVPERREEEATEPAYVAGTQPGALRTR